MDGVLRKSISGVVWFSVSGLQKGLLLSCCQLTGSGTCSRDATIVDNPTTLRLLSFHEVKSVFRELHIWEISHSLCDLKNIVLTRTADMILMSNTLRNTSISWSSNSPGDLSLIPAFFII